MEKSEGCKNQDFFFLFLKFQELMEQLSLEPGLKNTAN